jgi:acetyl-CoA carboxylase carboxyl transferase subunit alpha
LWKDRRHAPEAAEALKLTAQDLMGLGVVDEVVPEPEGGAHRDHDLAAANLGTAVRRNLERLSALPIEELMQKRYDKFRKLGKYTEEVAAAVTIPDVS